MDKETKRTQLVPTRVKTRVLPKPPSVVVSLVDVEQENDRPSNTTLIIPTENTKKLEIYPNLDQRRHEKSDYFEELNELEVRR